MADRHTVQSPATAVPSAVET
uniref:RHA2A n=1 Tax=Arundo donax TaxID=35708 RepID=A0A0A9AH55_ARUDO